MKRARNPVSLPEEKAREVYANLGLDYVTGLPIEQAAWLALYEENKLETQQ